MAHDGNDSIDSDAPQARAEHGTSTSPARDALDHVRGRPIDVVVLEWTKFSTAGDVVDTFRELGLDANLVTHADFKPAPDRIAFLGGNARWHERVLDQIRPLPPTERPTVIVWHTEPLPLPRDSGLRAVPLTAREIAKVVLRDARINDAYSNARHMRRLNRQGIVDLLTVSEKSFQAFLAQEGVPTAHIPLGYHRGHGHLLSLERDIDVLFLGHLHVRRRKRILHRLQREGVPVQVLGDYGDARYWGDSRTELLNRTKILLNISRHPGLQNDVRLILGMATGALVISEPIYLPDPYVPGKHYVEAPLDELTATLRRYLADEQARREITAAGHAFVTRELTMRNSLALLLELAAANVQGSGSAREARP